MAGCILVRANFLNRESLCCWSVMIFKYLTILLRFLGVSLETGGLGTVSAWIKTPIPFPAFRPEKMPKSKDSKTNR